MEQSEAGRGSPRGIGKPLIPGRPGKNEERAGEGFLGGPFGLHPLGLRISNADQNKEALKDENPHKSSRISAGGGFGKL